MAEVVTARDILTDEGRLACLLEQASHAMHQQLVACIAQDARQGTGGHLQTLLSRWAGVEAHRIELIHLREADAAC